jgi:hypothetical protein
MKNEEQTKEPETVPCKWCGVETRMLATRECDRCWELHSRIALDPEIAKRMLIMMEHLV